MAASATKKLTVTPTATTHPTDPQHLKHKSGSKTAKTTIKSHLSKENHVIIDVKGILPKEIVDVRV